MIAPSEARTDNCNIMRLCYEGILMIHINEDINEVINDIIGKKFKYWKKIQKYILQLVGFEPRLFRKSQTP